MPTRRIFEVALLVAILARPAFGLAHLWSVKTLGQAPEGTFTHNFASVVAVLT